MENPRTVPVMTPDRGKVVLCFQAQVSAGLSEAAYRAMSDEIVTAIGLIAHEYGSEATHTHQVSV